MDNHQQYSTFQGRGTCSAIPPSGKKSHRPDCRHQPSGSSASLALLDHLFTDGIIPSAPYNNIPGTSYFTPLISPPSIALLSSTAPQVRIDQGDAKHISPQCFAAFQNAESGHLTEAGRLDPDRPLPKFANNCGSNVALAPQSSFSTGATLLTGDPGEHRDNFGDLDTDLAIFFSRPQSPWTSLNLALDTVHTATTLPSNNENNTFDEGYFSKVPSALYEPWSPAHDGLNLPGVDSNYPILEFENSHSTLGSFHVDLNQPLTNLRSNNHVFNSGLLNVSPGAHNHLRNPEPLFDLFSLGPIQESGSPLCRSVAPPSTIELDDNWVPVTYAIDPIGRDAGDSADLGETFDWPFGTGVEENTSSWESSALSEQGFSASNSASPPKSDHSHFSVGLKRLPLGRAPPKPEANGALTIIQEDGKVPIKVSIPHTRRGGRQGKLPAEKSATIAKKRKAHDVCIKCKTARSECTGGVPCQRCRTAWQRKPNLVHQPCLKAHFLDIIESGSCNYVSQRAINHLSLDGMRRSSIEMPEEWNLAELLRDVQAREARFNIRRRAMSNTVFEIDLASHAEFLQDIMKKEGVKKISSFRDFINSGLLDVHGWRSSVKDVGTETHLLSFLGVWNNEPCRASYDIVPLDGSQPRPLDVDNEDDVAEIIIAAQLSRIICRKAEIDGYKALQTQINKLRFESSDSAIQFVKQTAKILLTLRWRLSWWDLHGDGRKQVDPARLLYVERVRRLTMVLYFYFFTAKRMIGSWAEPEGLTGVWSNYADTLPMWDDFPLVESLDGFEGWLEKGKDIVRAAGNEKKAPHLRGSGG